MNLFKLNKLDFVKSSVINNLFIKLDEIRQKFNISKTFSTNITSQNDYVTPTYPTKLKEDLQILADNSVYTKRPENTTQQYITNYYPNSINIPQIKDYIMAIESYNDYVDLINELDKVCVDCSDYANYTSDYSNSCDGGCDGGCDGSCDGSCEDCSTYQSADGGYCQACTWDFPGGS